MSKTNAVEVALHRALARLRSILESEGEREQSTRIRGSRRTRRIARARLSALRRGM